jgi:hypothetical protein
MGDSFWTQVVHSVLFQKMRLKLPASILKCCTQLILLYYLLYIKCNIRGGNRAVTLIHFIIITLNVRSKMYC